MEAWVETRRPQLAFQAQSKESGQWEVKIIAGGAGAQGLRRVASETDPGM